MVLTKVNTIGPLVLFQATYSLLHANTPTPKFIVMSATGGSITFGTLFDGLLAYGASKAGVNCVTRQLHFGHDNLGAPRHLCIHLLPFAGVTVSLYSCILDLFWRYQYGHV